MSEENDDFFVGYLPTPPRLARWLVRSLAALVLMFALLAGIIAANQRDPGNGTWNLDHADTIGGVIYARPYPMLLADGRVVLLVNEGKRGVGDEQVAALDRRRVRVSGHFLRRNGQDLLELSSPPTLISSELQQPLEISSTVPMTLKGEIIEPKCFSGAMKPGEGKTHKGCAALCLRGGIPPMFMTISSGQMRCYLLCDERGGPIAGDQLDELIAFVGDAVEVRGERGESHGLQILKVSSGAIRRLTK